jgi:putative restriction endonuclease
LFDLIQYSKVVDSQYWGGSEAQIGNTPQQGINWVGIPPACLAVIIKTRPGSYEEDGWADEERTSYRYSFKARGGEISYSEKANEVLISQPQYLYPILLFTETKDSWVFEGTFSVAEIESKYVVLNRGARSAGEQISLQEEVQYQEGGRKYVAHLMAERSKGVVQALKSSSPWVCDICSMKFIERYGVAYIEAHHKVPISTYSSTFVVNTEDFSLLCPNCHKAVHIHMKKEGLEYPQIKEKLRCKKV